MRKWLRDIRRIRVKKASAAELNVHVIVVNLYITQSLLFIIGMTIIFFQPQSLLELLKFTDGNVIWWTLLFSGAAVLLNIALTPLVPEQLQETDEVNVMLAKQLPLWHLTIVCAMVGFVEELLFRGAIQYALGPYWTSILFALIHVHYLRHWVLTGVVFLMSYGLGWLYDHTGTLWTSIAAHALFDFIMFCIVRYDIGGRYGKKGT